MAVPRFFSRKERAYSWQDLGSVPDFGVWFGWSLQALGTVPGFGLLLRFLSVAAPRLSPSGVRTVTSVYCRVLDTGEVV